MDQITRRGAILGTAAAAATATVSTEALADQDNMHDAVRYLQQAIASLQRASSGKGGHRAKALDLAQRALQETREGIVFARRK
ncbi:hypothetical protein [Acuticoccus mangrovi]|uniref:Uncharacterized protein n=1 Tax=Acuticoccus mangrovi TaxID=2796142 RepID=A0A934IIZ0_9HYPH|nr:hypothetical protein [Acuticoccus mangrovi]MBJ3777559.1 hypothetical protein [Acuticoccus mangrovi]